LALCPVGAASGDLHNLPSPHVMVEEYERRIAEEVELRVSDLPGMRAPFRRTQFFDAA